MANPPTGFPGSIRQVVALAARTSFALALRPHLWLTAGRQAMALAPRRWWATPPYLPIPPADYVRFRQVTLSGDEAALPTAGDLITWLEWCRSLRRLPREG